MLAADGSRHCRQPQFRKPRAVCGCVLAEPTQLSLALIGSSFGDPHVTIVVAKTDDLNGVRWPFPDRWWSAGC